MSPKPKAKQEEAPTSTKKFGGFRPVNDKCRDCGAEVGKGDRQELGWDEEGNCRRICGKCLAKLEIK